MECFRWLGWNLGDFGYLEEFDIEMVPFNELEWAFVILVWYASGSRVVFKVRDNLAKLRTYVISPYNSKVLYSIFSII